MQGSRFFGAGFWRENPGFAAVPLEKTVGCVKIDGGLIGGASLVADDFVAICRAGK